LLFGQKNGVRRISFGKGIVLSVIFSSQSVNS
jgi:hypothetical protein